MKRLIDQMLLENGITDVTCGTVHAFQGDQKDIILFSTAITGKTSKGTYNWLKNNKELINVATSRASEKLVVLSNLNKTIFTENQIRSFGITVPPQSFVYVYT